MCSSNIISESSEKHLNFLLIQKSNGMNLNQINGIECLFKNMYKMFKIYSSIPIWGILQDNTIICEYGKEQDIEYLLNC